MPNVQSNFCWNRCIHVWLSTSNLPSIVCIYLFKDRTKSRAEAKNLNTARLPIDEYMERKREQGNHSFSKVLTVNQGMYSR